MLELEEQISDAFVGEGDEDAWCEPSVSDELLDVTPAPKPVADDELEDEATRYRRVVVREGRGVPLVLIAAVGGSLLFHLLIWGTLLIALLFYVHPINHGEGNSAGNSDAGGSGAGYMITGEASKGEAAIAGKIPDVVLPPIQMPVAKPTPTPILPTHPDIKPIVPDRLADVTAIGLPASPDPLGTMKPTPPAPIIPKPLIEPPVQLAQVTPPTIPLIPNEKSPTDGGKTAPVAHSPKGGIGEGGDDNDNDPIIDITKPGKGGDGFGTGNGQGNGIDRGESGANIPQPMVLAFDFNPTIDLMRFPKKNVILEVLVLPTGRAGKITLKQSCGMPDIDAAFQKYVQTECKFRPARRAGNAIEGVMLMAWGPEVDNSK